MMSYGARPRYIIAWFATMIPLAITAGPAPAADARAGERFATENCGRCHAIGTVGASPLAKAPPFRIIARRYKLQDLEESLAEGIVTGHNAMPEFTLSPRQIDDLVAHLRRLKVR
jgi:mono/diheme cytochrome c family protein